MTEPAPETQDASGRYTVAQYFDLVRQGVLQPDDRVELLEGVIPDAMNAVYRTRRFSRRGERIALVAIPEVHVAVAELLPPSTPHDRRT